MMQRLRDFSSFFAYVKQKKCLKCISAFTCNIKDEHLYFSLTKFSPCLTFCLLCTTMAAPSLIRFCCILLPVCLSSTLAAIDEISINQQESWPRLASSSSSLSANEASAQNINDTLTSAKMKRNRKKLR